MCLDPLQQIHLFSTRYFSPFPRAINQIGFFYTQLIGKLVTFFFAALPGGNNMTETENGCAFFVAIHSHFFITGNDGLFGANKQEGPSW